MIDLDRLSELLAGLEAVGVKAVIPEGENLRLIPAVAIPSDLLAQVKAHKADLLAALRTMYQPMEPGAEWEGWNDWPVTKAERDPCPTCNSLELWQTAAGTWRCQHCDAGAFQPGLGLAERAARLRKQAQPRKPAHQDNAGCVPGGTVDMLDPKGKRPVQGQLRGFGGT